MKCEESVEAVVFREGLEVLVQVLAFGAGGLEVLRGVDALDDAYACGSGERLAECGVENSGPYRRGRGLLTPSFDRLAPMLAMR